MLRCALISSHGVNDTDVGYALKSMPHYIENTGTTKLRYLELWQSDHFADISLETF
jgi:oxalate decarboxylase